MLAFQVVRLELAQGRAAKVFLVVAGVGLKAGGDFPKVDIRGGFAEGGSVRRHLLITGAVPRLGAFIPQCLVAQEVFLPARAGLVLQQRVFLPAVRVVFGSAGVVVRLPRHGVQFKGRRRARAPIQKDVVFLHNFQFIVGDVLFSHGDAFLVDCWADNSKHTDHQMLMEPRVHTAGKEKAMERIVPPNGDAAGPSRPQSFTGRMSVLWTDALGRASIRAVQTLAVLALAWTVVTAAVRVPLVTIPVLVALILASAMAPAVRWLAARGWPRALAVLSSFLLILAIAAGVVGGIIALVRQEASVLAARAEAGIGQLQQFVTTGPVALTNDQIGAARAEFQKFLAGGTLGADALTGLRTAGEIAAGTVLTAVILFFFLKDGEKIRAFLIGFLPGRRQGKAHLAADRSIVVLGGYVRGTLVIAAIDAVIVLIGLLVLRVPLAVPLAAVVFLGGFIPIIGATTAGSLAVLVALVENGPVPALIVLVLLVAANQFEHHILQPLFMGRVLRIHGLVIILALAAGATLAGVIGALLAVPLTAVGWTVYKTLAEGDAPGPEPVAPDGSRPAGS